MFSTVVEADFKVFTRFLFVDKIGIAPLNFGV